jgi:hypothetical protein
VEGLFAENAGPMQECKCGRECVMTAQYWATVLKFVNDTGLPLIFGLNPADPDNAASLVYHTRHQQVRAASQCAPWLLPSFSHCLCLSP